MPTAPPERRTVTFPFAGEFGKTPPQFSSRGSLTMRAMGANEFEDSLETVVTATLDTDYLVIGSGLAGLNGALRLAESGGEVVLVTKRQPDNTATHWAQGGIASVMTPDDSIDLHYSDTLKAGAGLCDPAAARSILADGPKAIERLVALGVRFDRDPGGFALTREGGHSRRRILHSRDVTGREIMRALQAQVAAHSSITVLADHIAIDVITTRKMGISGMGSSDRCLGAYVLASDSGTITTVRARATLLATGGAGKAYLYTSNPDTATGDGVAMAFRAGAPIANMEFFQFHPTCLYHPRAKSFLISEALRGEGGILRRQDGTAFMASVHPMADLAPRDVVARAIDLEMKRTGDDCVYLDMTHKDPDFLADRFPNIHASCLNLQIDMRREPIPVVPAAHYMCGGVRSDLNGATEIPGLWVAGETAYTGLHGANRLASNSLLEAVVMSDRCAVEMVRAKDSGAVLANVPEWDSGDAQDPDEMVVVSHNWDELRRAMWSYVGIVRSDRRLERAAKRVAMLREEVHDYYWNFKLTHDLLELRNLSLVANLVVTSAARRRESRGLHFNTDTPKQDTHLGPSLLWRRSGGAVRWEVSPPPEGVAS